MYWLVKFTYTVGKNVVTNGHYSIYCKSTPDKYLLLLDSMRIEGNENSIYIIKHNYIIHKVDKGIYSVTVNYAGLWNDLSDYTEWSAVTYANQWSIEPTWKLKLVDKILANCDYKFLYGIDGSLVAIDIFYGQVSYRIVIKGSVYKLYTGCQYIGTFE